VNVFVNFATSLLGGTIVGLQLLASDQLVLLEPIQSGSPGAMGAGAGAGVGVGFGLPPLPQPLLLVELLSVTDCAPTSSGTLVTMSAIRIILVSEALKGAHQIRIVPEKQSNFPLFQEIRSRENGPWDCREAVRECDCSRVSFAWNSFSPTTSVRYFLQRTKRWPVHSRLNRI
jgi:hypothetical protein